MIVYTALHDTQILYMHAVLSSRVAYIIPHIRYCNYVDMHISVVIALDRVVDLVIKRERPRTVHEEQEEYHRVQRGLLFIH